MHSSSSWSDSLKAEARGTKAGKALTEGRIWEEAASACNYALQIWFVIYAVAGADSVVEVQATCN